MTFFINGYPRLVQACSATVIVYVDESWRKERLGAVPVNITEAVQNAQWPGGNLLYYIAFLWRDGETSMVDLWRFTANPVDEISAFFRQMERFSALPENLSVAIAQLVHNISATDPDNPTPIFLS